MYWDLIPILDLPKSRKDPEGGVTMFRMDKKFTSRIEALNYAKAHGITRYRVEKAKDSGEGSYFNADKMVSDLNKSRHSEEESMKKGGMVKKTKSHLLHKGELVVPATVVKHLEKLLKKK